MAFNVDQLDKKRMRNLAGVTVGKVMGTTTGLAISASAENIQVADAAVAMQLPNGRISATVQDTDIDLSDVAICAEAGLVIATDCTEFCIFVLQDGTNVLARVGSETVRKKRTSVTGALTTEKVRNTVPLDVDNTIYVVTGFGHFTYDGSAAHVIGTTALTVANAITAASYYETCNLLAGSRAI